MLFFKRILKEPETHVVVRKERRGLSRLPIHADFPLKAALGFDRRGGTVAPMGQPGGPEWKGRLRDCSEFGARIVLGPSALASRGDSCELRLSLNGFSVAKCSLAVRPLKGETTIANHSSLQNLVSER